MKLLVAICLAYFSFQASAAALVAEAECTGMLDGEKITVQGLVNPSNWCEEPANDNNSVILIKQGEDISVITTITTETELPTEELEVALTSSEDHLMTKLTYKIDGVPGYGPAKLEIIDETETTSVDLQCDFPAYHMDC